MALVSPGVQVTVIDESFYTPAEPGTTPLIVVASGQDKSNSAGTGTAVGTLKANAGKAYKMTSQKDLVDFFGIPFFEKTASNTPIHGSERNEYGLLAAYSYLSSSASAFIVRADVNLDELAGSATAPGAEPTDGQWWIDTKGTAWGIQEWNGAAATTTGGQKFATKTPIVLTNDDAGKITSNTPKGSVGSIGDYAVVIETGTVYKENAKLFYKSAGGGSGSGIQAGDWVEVGSNDWVGSHPSVVGTKSLAGLPAGEQFSINGTVITVGLTLDATVTAIANAQIAGVTAKNVNNRLYIYSNGATETTDDSSRSGNVVIAAVGGSTLIATAAADSVLGIASGTYYPPALQLTPHTSVPQWKNNNAAGQVNRPTGSVWIKTTEPNGGARLRVKRWSHATQAWVAFEAPMYDNGQSALYFLDRSRGGLGIPADTLYTQANATENFSYRTPDTNTLVVDESLSTAEFRVFKRVSTGATKITSNVVTGSTFSASAKTFKIKQSIAGSASLSAETSITFTGSTTAATAAENFATAINSATFVDSNGDAITNQVQASITADNEVVIQHISGGDIRFTDSTGNPIAAAFTPFNSFAGTGTANFYQLSGSVQAAGALEGYVASNWEPLAVDGYVAAGTTPLNEPADGQLWYNPEFSEVDMMVHNGTTWVGYRDTTAFPNSSPNGVIVSASAPDKLTGQSDGTALVQGDIWVSTADLENFPTIYRWNGLSLEWELLDKTDQLTEDGILFADARYGAAGATGNVATTIKEMTLSNYLDTDAPDPALYPKGMLLWNLRRSGGNVKKYSNNYIDKMADNVRMNNESMGNYATELNASKVYDRWTTVSGNNEDGSGSFGRHAQRKVVQAALKSVIDTSQEIRDEERRNFNLIACPGYPETMSNLVNLNIDRGLTAFVIGDTPLRLKADATSLINYGTNAALVTDNNDAGIVTYDEYAAVYYPNGFTTDLGGNNAVVPASHMMLKTYALSDNVSYPWFAPAGTRRGGITNATSVGYIDPLSGEFQTVSLNGGTRDVLYDQKINPIPFFVGVGLVAYGQKTRAKNASALDRVNVARLVVYLRSQLTKLARPYIFEPNDKITRDEIKGAVESLMLELVGLRALYDFTVVCDTSNNTASRIDRNELWVDIAIQPVKAVEFIYIPLRLKNTGEK